MDDSAPWKTEETIVGWPRLLVAVSFPFSCILQIWWLSPFLSSTPERCRRQEPLGRNGPTAFTLCHRASGPFRAPFALPSQWIQGREVEMTVQCQNRANCAGVYRCQI